MNEFTRALFVTWQDPRSRSIVPVARLAAIHGPDCSSCFEFAYIRAATEATQHYGFRPFLGFPELNKVYRSKSLFPMFANRVMSRQRADFGEYLDRLHLPAATTDPLEILKRSGGRRETDGIELIAFPEYEDGCYVTWFWLRGVRHLGPDERIAADSLQPGQHLHSAECPGNAVDPRAIAIKTEAGVRVGYLPAYLLDDAWNLNDRCEYLDITVEHVNPPPGPPQERALCRLMTCWPENFEPYSSSRFQPISVDAATFVEGVSTVAD